MTLTLYKPFSASQEYFLNLNVSFLFFYLLIMQFLKKESVSGRFNARHIPVPEWLAS